MAYERAPRWKQPWVNSITMSGRSPPLFSTLTSVSTIGGGGDTTIPSPGMAPKQPLLGIRLHDPRHGRQACPEFSSFHQGLGQISPSEGLFSCRPLPKRGQICYIPAPSPSLNASYINRHAGTLENIVKSKQCSTPSHMVAIIYYNMGDKYCTKPLHGI